MSMNFSSFTKFNIVGTSGSGKSTVAKLISEKLSIPYVEMDRIFWKPEWTTPSGEEFLSLLDSELKQDSWILDGNYTSSVPIKWKEVQVVVWIDLPFSITLYQAVKRAMIRSITKIELWPNTGNTESFIKSFLSKDSIILWTIQTYSKVKLRLEGYMEDDQYSHIKFVRLKSKKEIKNFLDSLKEVE